MRHPLSLSVLTLGLMLPVGAAPQLSAQEAALRAAPSGRVTTEVTFSYPRGQGPADAKPLKLRLDYGQPHLRGRALHTDSLVPYDTPWRLGANAATTLTTDLDLLIGGAPVPAGTYVLYAIPGRAGWKLVVQKSAGQSPMSFDSAHDVARIDLKHRTLPMAIESLSMWIIPSREPGVLRGDIRIAWGNVELSTDWRAK